MWMTWARETDPTESELSTEAAPRDAEPGPRAEDGPTAQPAGNVTGFWKTARKDVLKDHRDGTPSARPRASTPETGRPTASGEPPARLRQDRRPACHGVGPRTAQMVSLLSAMSIRQTSPVIPSGSRVSNTRASFSTIRYAVSSYRS